MNFLFRRVKDEANYIIENGSTVREAAKVFGISKSTIHKDMTDRLPCVDKKMYAEVRKVLDKNLSERHIRGGIATKVLYEKRKK